jgi:hypothetical protein
MSQTRMQSMVETLTNIGVGYGLNFTANLLVFPHFGWQISARQNVVLGVIYTGVSLARGFGLRRLFNRWHR